MDVILIIWSDTLDIIDDKSHTLCYITIKMTEYTKMYDTLFKDKPIVRSGIHVVVFRVEI